MFSFSKFINNKVFAIWQPKAYRYKYNTQLIFTVTLQWAWNVKQRIWKCSYLSMSTKVHLYQALVMSVLLYGSLDTPGCRHRHARSAFIWSASGRCSTSTGGTISPMQRYSRKQACQQSAKSIRNRRLSLFGHVARLDPEVPANKVNSHEGRKPSSSWTRPPGRPRRTWLNLVQEDANAIPLSSIWRTEIFRGHGAAQRSVRTTRWWWWNV